MINGVILKLIKIYQKISAVNLQQRAQDYKMAVAAAAFVKRMNLTFKSNLKITPISYLFNKIRFSKTNLTF